jgi:hypothetical protein
VGAAGAGGGKLPRVSLVPLLLRLHWGGVLASFATSLVQLVASFAVPAVIDALLSYLEVSVGDRASPTLLSLLTAASRPSAQNTNARDWQPSAPDRHPTVAGPSRSF